MKKTIISGILLALLPLLGMQNNTVGKHRFIPASGGSPTCASCATVRVAALAQGVAMQTTPFSSNTAGNFIVVGLELNLASSSSLACTVSDSAGNTYVSPAGLGPYVSFNTGWQQLQYFYATSIAASAGTNTVTPSCATGYAYTAVFADEVGGAVGTVTYDGPGTPAGNNGLGTAMATGSFTITANDYVAGWMVQTGSTATAGSGFTAQSNCTNYFCYEDGVFNATSVNVTMTAGSSASWGLLGAAFK